MTTSLWIRDPLAILAEDAEGGVVVQGGRIVELVRAGRQPIRPVDGVFDASGHVVLPGLVNAHHHFFQTLTRAFPPALNKALFPWLRTMLPVWQHLEPGMVSAAARLAMAELLLSGCTTAADHHYLFTPALQDAVDLEVEAARSLGLRVTLCRGSIDHSEADGGLAPVAVTERRGHILEHTQALLERYNEPGDGAMVRIAVAPCTPFEASTALMRDSAALARRYEAPLHTHLAETEQETQYCLECFGQRPVEYLEELGWLGPDLWLAHGVHLDDTEVRRLGARGVGVCHCPSSNAVLGSGLCRVPELERAGCPVGLGVDGSSSNDASNLAQEARQAFLTQRLAYGAEGVDHLDALRWATEGGARCLGRRDIGRIAEGLCADLALFRLDTEPRFSGHADPIAALVLCGAHRADRVMVNGQWAVADGQLVNADLGEIMSAHARAARRLQALAL
ncbi:8-oxoguanine deaminase [Ectothiorhodospiraceae bacterium WFHF3C12]|nr:8-oxoguanine deaminase [Ectothiorhodospiraceae bacterium WFHF3C12]